MPTYKLIPHSYANHHPDRYELAKERGYPCMAEVLRYHETLIGAGAALGFKSSGTYQNLFADSPKARPGRSTELMARHWLEANTREHAPDEASPTESDPAVPVEGVDMLLVIPPADKLEKVKRVLTMLGCEVEAV